MKWITLLLALQLIPSLSFAMGGKGDHQKRADFLQKELNLTNEQLEKVTAIRKKHHGDKDDKNGFRRDLPPSMLVSPASLFLQVLPPHTRAEALYFAIKAPELP